MRHRLDWLSLLLGLLLGLVAVAGLNGWITADVVDRELLLPAGLVLAGLVLAGVVGAVTGRVPTHDQAPAHHDEAASAAEEHDAHDRR